MKVANDPGEDQVASVRRFNRFYTRQIGLLNEGLLKSEFSLTEVRVLYELAHRKGLTATALGADLGLDPGYLSRLLKKSETRGFLARHPLAQDARQSVLGLTAQGRKAFGPLDKASRDQVAALLGRLAIGQRQAMVGAMRTIQRLLDDGEECDVARGVAGKGVREKDDASEDRAGYRLRSPKVGDIGWITHRQAVLYAEEYGWDETYEALVAEILARFVKDFDARHERAWIAERNGEVVGSVFLVRQSDAVAKLRLLYVEPLARGLGIGRRLVDECIRFARVTGYRTLALWTNDVLVSARRIYLAAGFELVQEDRHHSFGKDLVGQNWNLAL